MNAELKGAIRLAADAEWPAPKLNPSHGSLGRGWQAGFVADDRAGDGISCVRLAPGFERVFADLAGP